MRRRRNLIAGVAASTMLLATVTIGSASVSVLASPYPVDAAHDPRVPANCPGGYGDDGAGGTTWCRISGLTLDPTNTGPRFAGQYAIIGLSRVREHIFDGLPLTRTRTEPLECGVWVVDTTTGDTVAHLAFDGLVQEIFEVALLRGLRFPELVEPGAPLGDTAFVLPDFAMADVANPAQVTGEIS